MEWYWFLLIAGGMVGILMYFNRRAKAKEPIRTDYKPQMAKGLTRDDSKMESLLNNHRGNLLKPHKLKYLRPEALLFKIAKEHCKYMLANGKASHDGSNHRIYVMRTNNAKATGECTSHGFKSVISFFNQYLKHKDEKGNYTHRHVIEGDFNSYGHCMLKDKKNKNFDVLILALF